MQRIALVTGFSRRTGIAAAIVERLLGDGLAVLATGWPHHDQHQSWGEDEEGGQVLADRLDPSGDRLMWVEADLARAETPGELVDRAVDRFGALDVVVACHARSSRGGVASVTVDELDQSWAVNARASVLLARELARVFDPVRGNGRLVLFTSGQHLGAMADEIAYVVSKGAIQQMTTSVAADLAPLSITVNCVNPGPVDTGWADPATHAAVEARFRAGRWGQPTDAANLVSFLVSAESAWISGQTINSEGGFVR